MSKKKLLIISILVFSLFFSYSNVFAKEITVGDETLTESKVKNTDNTALFDSDNDILTLTNYDGGGIKYSEDADLTIVLNGNNTITSDYNDAGIYTEKDVTIKGDGSLLIKNTVGGLVTNDGSLTIDSGVSITIENAEAIAVEVHGGKLIINGDLVVNNDSEVVFNALGFFDGFQAIHVSSDIEINGNLTISKSEGFWGYGACINTNGDLIINLGEVNINADSKVRVSKSFILNGGKVNIEIYKGDGFTAQYGIDAGAINLVKGYLHVVGFDGLTAVAAFGDYPEDPELTIGSAMNIKEDGYKVVDTDFPLKTIGTSQDDIASEVTIYSKHTVTFDANGASGSMEEKTFEYGEKYTLPDNRFTAIAGKRFKGWSLEKNGDIISEVYIDGDKSVYAIWEDIPKEYKYVFIDGDKQILTINNIKAFILKIDGDYSLFASIKIGNLDLVKDKDYIIREGSTLITFTKNGIDKLNTLSKGEHEILITYSNGKKVTGSVTVNEDVKPEPKSEPKPEVNPDSTEEKTNNPKTNDIIYPLVGASIISFMTIVLCMFYSKKIKFNK